MIRGKTQPLYFLLYNPYAYIIISLRKMREREDRDAGETEKIDGADQYAAV